MRAAALIYAIYAMFTRIKACNSMIANESLRVYAIYAPHAHTYACANARAISVSHARIYT